MCFLSDAGFWYRAAADDIDAALRQERNTGVARNVILFLGDGMGISTVTAARIFKGQQHYGKNGEETVLAWEEFPNLALSKVHLQY